MVKGERAFLSRIEFFRVPMRLPRERQRLYAQSQSSTPTDERLTIPLASLSII
jgi:hypothetical protein